MSRGGATWVLAAAGVILVILITAAIGGRDKSDETVPAGEWAQSVCGAVGVWRGEFDAVIEDIRTPAAFGDAGVDEPQSETPQSRRGFIRAGLERAVQATDTLVEGLDNAGAPDTPQGQQAAQQISDWASSSKDDLEQAQDSLDNEADTLEEAIQQITSAAGALGTTLASGVRTFAQVAASDPALAAALRDSSTCQQLREREEKS
ncbi:MAG TPA: hypothetical protein VFG75_05705 [Gaiella sp.]|nr:hypothetical protein [Gaiella sp.]